VQFDIYQESDGTWTWTAADSGNVIIVSGDHPTEEACKHDREHYEKHLNRIERMETQE